jgi:hypothetical protein
MVGCNGYRNPALLAKITSIIDVASHGRLYAGIDYVIFSMPRIAYDRGPLQQCTAGLIPQFAARNAASLRGGHRNRRDDRLYHRRATTTRACW